MSVALVTDSTALSVQQTAAAHDITVVPLQVVIDASSYDESGADVVTPQMLADALKEWTPVSRQPNPEAILEHYERLAGEGAKEIVSVHVLQGFGRPQSPSWPRARASVPVAVVDSPSRSAWAPDTPCWRPQPGDCRKLSTPVTAGKAGTPAQRHHLAVLHRRPGESFRRGGGRRRALLGWRSAVEPILKVDDGNSRSRCVRRRGAVPVGGAFSRGGGDAEVDVAVAHLAGPTGPPSSATRLGERLENGLGGREIDLGEIGAVLGAHVGPGMVAVAVARRV